MAVERRRKEDKEKAKQEELKLLQETEEHAETQVTRTHSHRISYWLKERKRIEAEKERLEKINLRVTKYMSLPQKVLKKFVDTFLLAIANLERACN